MDKYRAIPEGYMTVGELAGKMGTTVRTLQYYDSEGILSPSAESEGGRRLYTDKDVIKLHQVLSMKYLGFSLDVIKNRLITLDTPAEVAKMLTEHGAAIREKMETLSESLKAIEVLKSEVLQMQAVDFRKYADIIVNLQVKNEFYWLIKHFDNETLDYVRNRFDQDSSLAMMESYQSLQNEAIQLQKDNVSPESEEGQDFAKAFWDMLMEFTGGDFNMLTNLMKLNESLEWADDDNKSRQVTPNAFIEPALEVYLTNMGINPFEEEPE